MLTSLLIVVTILVIGAVLIVASRFEEVCACRTATLAAPHNPVVGEPLLEL